MSRNQHGRALRLCNPAAELPAGIQVLGLEKRTAPDLQDAPIVENETAVAAVNDFPRLVDDMLQVLPQTRQVFIVMGSGEIGRFWRRELNAQQEISRSPDLCLVDDLSLPEILRRCATLTDHSAIFYLTFGTDAAGAAYADERVLAELHATANAPLFAAHSVYLGAGIVGGSLMSIDDLSRDTADAASRIPNGASPSSVRVPPRTPGQPTFDWRELQRWGVDESRLPPGSVVRHRSPGLWHEHRAAVLIAAGALVIQAFLIIGLLFERRAWIRAEIDSRRNLALAADASRRATVSALASSVAHELSQPLGAMILNAEALQRLITTQIIERKGTMLRSHPLQKKPITFTQL